MNRSLKRSQRPLQHLVEVAGADPLLPLLEQVTGHVDQVVGPQPLLGGKEHDGREAEAGVERVLTMDLHAAQIQGFFDIPVDNLYASPIFALDILTQFKDDLKDVLIISPDVGGVARARELAKRINAPLSMVDKRREKAGEVAEMTVIGDGKDKICLIVDDMCDTAGTLCKAAQVLLDNGAKEVHSYITHGVMSGPAVERVTNSVMKSLVLTDTIQPTKEILKAKNIRIVPTAPIFTQAILNIWNGTSVSSLFEDKTLTPIYESMYQMD